MINETSRGKRKAVLTNRVPWLKINQIKYWNISLHIGTSFKWNFILMDFFKKQFYIKPRRLSQWNRIWNILKIGYLTYHRKYYRLRKILQCYVEITQLWSLSLMSKCMDIIRKRQMIKTLHRKWFHITLPPGNQTQFTLPFWRLKYLLKWLCYNFCMGKQSSRVRKGHSSR